MRRYLAAAAAALLACLAPAAAAQRYTDRPEVRQFIAEMTARHAFAERTLERLFSTVRAQDSVLTLVAPPPPGARSWRVYRSNFVNARRIEAGVAFWGANAAALERAAREFGVPPQIVVAIIGVESEYGRNTGAFRVLDALATLAFDYPRRAEYFRSELEQYLLYTREAGLDAAALRGSYAGAIGIPQFMPGSIRRFGVDFDGDGHRALMDGEVVPIHRPEVLRAAGVEFAAPVDPDAPCVLVELESPDAPPVHLVGLQNFYALTRYNRSSFYAAAVNDLADAIKVARGAR